MSADPPSDTDMNSSLSYRPRGSGMIDAYETPQTSTLPTPNVPPPRFITPDTSLLTEESNDQSLQGMQYTTTTTISNEAKTQEDFVLANPVNAVNNSLNSNKTNKGPSKLKLAKKKRKQNSNASIGVDASQPSIVQFLAQKKQKQSVPEALFPQNGASTSEDVAKSTSTPSAQPYPVDSPAKIKINIPSIKSILFDIETDPVLLRRFSELGKQLLQSLFETNDLSPIISKFMEEHSVDKDTQKKYADGKEYIEIQFTEENDSKSDYAPEIYLLRALLDKEYVFVKAGVCLDGRRRGDYVQNENQKYIPFCKFEGASDDMESQMNRDFKSFFSEVLMYDNIAEDFRETCQSVLAGAMDLGMRRNLATRAAESFLTVCFGIEKHRLNNPHEFLACAGSNDLYKERKENLNHATDKLEECIRGHTGAKTNADDLSFEILGDTWPVAEEFFDQEKNGEYISAQVTIAEYTISSVPGAKGKRQDLLEKVINPTHAYDTSFTAPQRAGAVKAFGDVQAKMASKKGSVAIFYVNSEATKGANRKNLYEVATKDLGWQTALIIESEFDQHEKSKCRPITRLCVKNNSCIIFMNSSGTATNPKKWFSALFQRDVLFHVHIVNQALSRFSWDGESGIETKETAFMAANCIERMDLIHTGPFYQAILTKARFVRDMHGIDMLNGDYGKYLNPTLYFTTPSSDMRLEFYYKDTMVFRIHIRNKGHVEFIKKRLKDRNLKANLNKIARSGEEYNDIATTLIQLLHSMYITKGDPEKEGILEVVFDHLYDDFRDSEKGLKTGGWGSKEIDLYIKGFLHCYGRILGDTIPSRDKSFDHATISAWIPTRCNKSLQTLKKNIMDKVTNKKTFTYQMYLEKLQELLMIRKKWEKYTGHYVVDRYARFASNKTHKFVVQKFKDQMHLYDDVYTRDQFIEDFISELKEENIRVYEYDHTDVSFRLVEEKLTKFFKEKFKCWRYKLKQGQL